MEGMTMADDGRIPAIEGAHLLKTLRASDFDIPSAIGELIDNSIQAKAKKIFVKIEDIPAGGKRRYNVINKIVCGDDGIGMDGEPKSVLHKCIKLGFSTRYDDRNGLGRFGVGMTLAGIRFATKIEVYSKEKEKDWFYIDFDLTNSGDTNGGIKEPIQKDLPKEFISLVGKESGTCVIWSGFDKIAEHDLHSSTYDDKIKSNESLDPYGDLNHWIGRTFRKFIWKDIRIFLNGNEIYSFDPLYENKKKNQFEDDEPAKIKQEFDLPWRVRRFDESGEYTEINSLVHVKISLLPLSYREVSGKGGLQFKGRYIDENQGISILRSDREVFYGEIPIFGDSRIKDGEIVADDEETTRSKRLIFGEKDRWWGCEISFSPDLDEYFAVKNIKRGAIPVKGLKTELYNKIRPVRDKCIKEVESDWKVTQQAEDHRTNTDENGENKTHKQAETVGKETKIPIKPKVGLNVDEKTRQDFLNRITQGLDELEKAQTIARFTSQPFIIIDQNWRGDTFFEMTYDEGKCALEYNLNHLFIDEIRRSGKKLKELDDPAESVKLAENFNALIDILLISFAQARQNYADDQQYTVKIFVEDFLNIWGRYLKNYTETYQKERDDKNHS